VSNDTFQFEEGTVPLDNGRLFTPKRDAVKRWSVRTPGYYRALGDDFQVLYEVHGGKFIFIDYRHCMADGMPTYATHLAKVGHWTGDVTRAELVSKQEALAWLLEYKLEVPDSLAGLIEDRSVVDPADIPSDDEAGLRWAWPLYPLKSGVGRNCPVPIDAAQAGQPVAVGSLQYYVPTAGDLASVKQHYADNEPDNPSWPQIEADLIVAGRTRDELAKLNAPTLVKLLDGARGPKGTRGHKGGRPPDTDPKADKRVAEAWATRQYKTYADLGRENGMTGNEVRAAIDRHRKR